jgi:hypothetical protein
MPLEGWKLRHSRSSLNLRRHFQQILGTSATFEQRISKSNLFLWKSPEPHHSVDPLPLRARPRNKSANLCVYFLFKSPHIHSVQLTHRQVFGRRAENEGSAILLATSIEPFQPSAFSKTRAGGSAYPHASVDGQAFSPFNLVVVWTDPADDAHYVALLQDLGFVIRGKARSLGAYVDGALTYPNYAVADTKLEDMYGVDGVRRLANIRKRWDPRDVMSLTGGFIIPFMESQGRADDEL